MSQASCFVSVVAPIRNDDDIIETFIQEVIDILRQSFEHYELVLIDDGSEMEPFDKVSNFLSKFREARLIRLSRPFGMETAILAGLESAIGDYVVVMEPEFDPPNLIPKMVDLARRGHDIVVGLHNSSQVDSIVVRFGSRIFYWYCTRVLKLRLRRYETNFRALSRRAVNALIRIKDRFRHSRMFGAFVGFSSTYIEYEAINRRGKQRRRNFWESAGNSVGVVVANSTHPLRVVSVGGLLVASLNITYVVYVLIVYIIKDYVTPGWATQALTSSTMFFFLFLTLAVLAEYIGRILQESMDRPQYYLLDEIADSVVSDEERLKNVVEESINKIE